MQRHLGEVVRATVQDTLNALLEAEADRLCGAGRYEHSPDRVDTRAGHDERQFQTQAGAVTLKWPKRRSLPFETAIIERYKRRETSVEEALLEMYYAGVSPRRVEDITEALGGLAGQRVHRARAEPEGGRPDRSLAQPADPGRARLRLPRRPLAEAPLGRRGQKRQRAGGHWGAKRDLDMGRLRDPLATTSEPQTA